MTKASRRKYHFIYKTTCLITGREYFGMHSTDDMDDGYLGSGKILRYSVKKYGKENHIREVFELLPDRKSLCLREAQIIDERRLTDISCMNLRLGGEGGPIRKGYKNSEEMKKKISASLMGHSSSDKVREQCKTIGLQSRNRKASEETRKKISEALKGRRSPLKGRRRPPSVCQKISEALKLKNALFPRNKRPKHAKVLVE